MKAFVQVTKKIKLFKQPPKIGDIETIDGIEYILVKFVDFEMKNEKYLVIKCIYQLATLQPKAQPSKYTKRTYTVRAQHKYTKFKDNWWPFEIGGLLEKEGNYYCFEELTVIELRGADLYLEYEVSKLEPFKTNASKKDLLEHRKNKIGLAVL